MEAKDLMIGDWVETGHLVYNKVQEIARDNDMQWYISYACGITLFRMYEFGPVPLTPEILEKTDSVSLRVVIGIRYGTAGGFIRALNLEHVASIGTTIGLAALT